MIILFMYDISKHLKIVNLTFLYILNDSFLYSEYFAVESPKVQFSGQLAGHENMMELRVRSRSGHH